MKKTIRYILLTVCVCVFCYSAYNLIQIYLNYKKIDDDYGEIAKTYTEEKVEEKESYLQINWDELLQRNKDVKAWIQIPNTNVNYPVLQGETNDTYIHSDIDHNELSAGSIFIASENEYPFNDFNTVIYGHNMGKPGMFYELTQYRSQEFLDEHKTFTITLDEQVLTYQIFSIYVTEPDYDYRTVNYPTEEGYQDFLDRIIARSMLASDASVTTADRIITLSTCVYDFNDARMAVHAVLLPSDDSTPEKQTP